MRVAKGVRISASSRGLRAHVGPRGSRLHFGSGRTGVSTGAGPVTYYSSLGGSSRIASGTRRSAGPTKTQIAQAEKEQEFLRLRDVLQSILDIHRAEFPRATKAVLPDPQLPDEKTFYKRREEEHIAGLSILKRRLRKEAKARARELAAEDRRLEIERLTKERAEAQADVDAEWSRLNSNDPETVIRVVDSAFEDNKAAAAPVNVEGSTISLVMLAPRLDEAPERKPALTPSGEATVKKMTKAERADAYLTLICGHFLATIKEALAAAPAISEIKGVVVRQADPDIYGSRRFEALLAARYERGDLDRVRWNQALSPDIVQQAARDLLWKLKGRPPELHALDLNEEPELKRFVDALSEKLLT